MSVKIIGHRGARGLFPESTLKGFSAALELQLDCLEIDVGITRDGVVVVHHDRTINPNNTRDATGSWLQNFSPKICDLTYEELSQFDIGRIKPGTDYAREFPRQIAQDGARIPTLAQVVTLLDNHEHQATLCIEAKYSPADSQSTLPLEAFAEILAEEINRLGISSNVIVQSFDWQFVRAIKMRLPQIRVWHLTSQLPSFHTLDETLNGLWTDGRQLSDYAGSVPQMVIAAGGESWSSDYESLDPESIGEAHRLGLKTYAWTVNKEADFQLLLDAGIDGIITDYPDRLIRFIEKQK